MKKIFASLFLMSALAACNNESGTTENKVDSLEQRKDTLLDKIDSTKDAKIDSIEKRSDDLKDKFDSTIEAKKDSVKGKTSK
ncbi:MAG TPA: hypothetical protein VHK91_15435 [Flavisolibacter sp.]|jgi:hypothetical protein|nr:hypothetical protein [Flavisolibacter sp.]